MGAVGVILAQMVYYYINGRYLRATQKGGKRSLDSVEWDVDPDTLVWPEIPADAEEVKRAIVVLDEAGNEIARTEKRTAPAVVELDGAGNELARSEKRDVVELDGAGNELSMDKLRRAVVELDAAGIELTDSEE